jgi:hypothetical protein
MAIICHLQYSVKKYDRRVTLSDKVGYSDGEIVLNLKKSREPVGRSYQLIISEA